MSSRRICTHSYSAVEMSRSASAWRSAVFFHLTRLQREARDEPLEEVVVRHAFPVSKY